jgi:hypothetical protein
LRKRKLGPAPGFFLVLHTDERAPARGALSIHGYIAMILGIVFSLVLGCGLMALMFYSSRHGYDEIDRRDL